MAADQTGTEYSAAAIRVLEGLEAVRLRPGMYIGSTGTRGLHHLVFEIVDNAVDEALAGVCTRIDVRLEPGNVVSVRDNGRGIPVGLHESGVHVPELVFTRLHAGAKFDSDTYKVSGGLHGVGAAVVNALSEWLDVRIERDRQAWEQRFERGRPTGPLTPAGRTSRRGTTIRFRPDPLIFRDLEFEPRHLAQRLRELAFLNAGLTIEFVDARGEAPRAETYCYEGGIEAFVTYLNADKKTLHPPLAFADEVDDIAVEVALQYNDGYVESITSFVNCINTTEGGYHETGFKTALTRVLNDVARQTGLWRKKAGLPGEDLREGLMAVLSLRMKDTEFEGQTKRRLGNAEARSVVERVVGEHLAAYLELNPDVAKRIVTKAVKAHDVRLAARKVREAARVGKSGLSRSSLDGKLTRCTSRKVEDIELFIVEGDSAGGNVKQGRDRRFQAILPMRGKVLNTERAPLDRVLKNKEILAIVHALGAGVGADFSLKAVRYGRVIILADADEDGAHIRCLLMTFFYRYMRPLVTEGRLFLAQPPLYKVERRRARGGPRIAYAWSSREMNRLKKQMDPGATVQRYKGLGEMTAAQLWETTMDPERRVLLQVTIDDAAAAEKSVSMLMGANAESRRAWITDNVRFGLTGEQPSELDRAAHREVDE